MRGKFKHHSHSEPKLLQANYDEIFSLDGECRICLTKPQIAWLLSQADYASWTTRWLASVPVDEARILGFHADMVRRLMDCLPCSGDDELYLLRQNPSNPCQLEQSTDGGVNWSLAFDYELCLFQQSINPPQTRIDPETGKVQQSIDGGETWYDVPDATEKTPRMTDVYNNKNDPACWHSANATELIRSMVMDSGDDLLIILSFIVNILLVIITGGATLPIVLTNLISGALAFGLGAIRTHMDQPGEWDKLREILYCTHDASWGWTPLGWDNAIDQIGVTFPAGVSLFLGGLIQTMGSIGLTNAGYLALVDNPSCLSFECGGDCGFVANGSQNKARWQLNEDRLDPTNFNGTLLQWITTASNNVAFAGDNRVLSGETVFEQPCYVTTVTLSTLGNPNASKQLVAYKVYGGSDWTIVETRSLASWAAGNPQVYTINANVIAIKVQNQTGSINNNHFSQIVIGDSVP